MKQTPRRGVHLLPLLCGPLGLFRAKESEQSYLRQRASSCRRRRRTWPWVRLEERLTFEVFKALPRFFPLAIPWPGATSTVARRSASARGRGARANSSAARAADLAPTFLEADAVPDPFTVSVSETSPSSVPNPHRPGSSVRKSKPASVASYSDEEELDMDGQVRGEIGPRVDLTGGRERFTFELRGAPRGSLSERRGDASVQ